MTEIFNLANLRQAWERAPESDGCAGADGVSLDIDEERINTVVMHPGAGIQTTWRGCIDLQVGHFIFH